jgi:hypothetical protein
MLAVLWAPNSAAAQTNKDVTKTELHNFDEFLDHHATIGNELAQNPSLLNDRAYLQKHPDLRDFLQTHPNTREELKENPRFFMQRERAFQQGEKHERGNDRDVTGTELHNFDEFLDSHASIAQDLKKNPSLVDDAAYLQKHPDLRGFLQSHPNTREELKENPRYFMTRENKYEKREHTSKR